MKNLLFPCLLASVIFACKPATSGETASATSDTTASALESAPAPVIQAVKIPEKDASWIDQPINETKPKLVISTPKGMKVYADGYGNSISVMLNDHQSMYIQGKPIDMAEQKKWYEDSRTNLQWLIDTDTEALYTGTDRTAPEGHQETNSFYAVRNIGGQDFSTSVDGIVVAQDGTVYALTLEQCQLLLGIFRTLRQP